MIGLIHQLIFRSNSIKYFTLADLIRDGIFKESEKVMAHLKNQQLDPVKGHAKCECDLMYMAPPPFRSDMQSIPI